MFAYFGVNYPGSIVVMILEIKNCQMADCGTHHLIKNAYILVKMGNFAMHLM